MTDQVDVGGMRDQPGGTDRAPHPCSSRVLKKSGLTAFWPAHIWRQRSRAAAGLVSDGIEGKLCRASFVEDQNIRSRGCFNEQFGRLDEIIGGHSEGLPIDPGQLAMPHFAQASHCLGPAEGPPRSSGCDGRPHSRGGGWYGRRGRGTGRHHIHQESRLAAGEVVGQFRAACSSKGLISRSRGIDTRPIGEYSAAPSGEFAAPRWRSAESAAADAQLETTSPDLCSSKDYRKSHSSPALPPPILIPREHMRKIGNPFSAKDHALQGGS
jgi:hypothetical protein